MPAGFAERRIDGRASCRAAGPRTVTGERGAPVVDDGGAASAGKRPARDTVPEGGQGEGDRFPGPPAPAGAGGGAENARGARDTGRVTPVSAG